MGSSFNIIFYHADSLQAIQIAHDCYLLVDSLNTIFSDYSATSEVGKLTHQAPGKVLSVSDELLQLILQSQQAWKKSDNTFDITVGPISRLWRKANTEKRFPTKDEIKKAKQETGFENLIIDSSLKTISFNKKGMRLDFGGIVPGYAAQKIIDFLKSKNINIALADASGDIVMSDAPPGKNGWTIAINLPENEYELWNEKLELKNCAVSTSGDIYRYTIHNGKKYSHIIDPRSGYGVTSQRNVTIIAKDGATADWLATASSILPVKKALKLAEKENVELLIATIKNEKIITYKTKKIDSYFLKKLP